MSIFVKCFTLFSCVLLSLKGRAQTTSYNFPVIRTISGYYQATSKAPNGKLVLLNKYIPKMKSKVYYATAANFTHQILYPQVAVYSSLDMALRLQKAANILKKKGLGICVFDAYRPFSITEKMWKIVPDNRYAANPSHGGSYHNRGAAVDLTLYDLTTGDTLSMPTGFDNFTEKAHGDYMHLSDKEIEHRTLLTQTMQSVGLIPLSTEWWHFSLPNGKKYPVLDIPFSELSK